MTDSLGVVYTKRWVAELVLDVAGYTSEAPILERTLCEPSCGCGSFLEVAVERLMEAARDAGRLTLPDLYNRIAAFDIDNAAVEASRNRVSSILMQKGISENLSKQLVESWIRQGDFLLNYVNPVDYVVGNPPYIRSIDMNRDLRKTYRSTLWSMTMGSDLYVGFIQHGLDILSNAGTLVYICPDRWLQNRYGQRLRSYIVDNGYAIDCLIRMHGVDAFEDEVDAYPSITRITHSEDTLFYVECDPAFSENDVPDLLNTIYRRSTTKHATFTTGTIPKRVDDSVVPLSDPETVELVSDLTNRFPSLEKAGIKVGIGLATGRDKVFVVENPNLVEPERMLPAFSMREYRRDSESKRWFVNPWDKDNHLVDLDDYPRLKAYFESHRSELSKRHVARASGTYYRTIDKPNWSIFGRPMLLFPDMSSSADPVLSDGSRYPCHNCYWMVSDEWDLRALGGLLMSDIATAFIDALGVKMRGKTLRFQAQYLRLIHVPKASSVPSQVKESLASAFDSGDREAADIAAREAYGL